MKEDDNKKPNNDDGRSKPKFENRRRVLGPASSQTRETKLLEGHVDSVMGVTT